MNIRFDGKTAVLFGGSRGIGKAIAFGLAKAGAAVYLCSHHVENARKTCTELKAAGYKAVHAGVDVSDHAQVDAFLERAQKETGRLDIVINNAGIVGTTPYLDCEAEEVERLFKVNVMGVDNGCKAAVRRMMDSGIEGKIVNIASFAGRRAMKSGFAHYGMSKSAVIYLTQAAAYAAAPYNINVNCICPGIIRTDMWEQILDSMTADGSDREEAWRDSLKTFIPLARGDQKPEDISYAVLFLCSQYASHITGQSLNVDGGASMD